MAEAVQHLLYVNQSFAKKYLIKGFQLQSLLRRQEQQKEK